MAETLFKIQKVIEGDEIPSCSFSADTRQDEFHVDAGGTKEGKPIGHWGEYFGAGSCAYRGRKAQETDRLRKAGGARMWGNCVV
ncbi:hypothetical protein CVT25_014146 [Psilocybe cyanescens]|uniref:Uncharacterized protein n=1 Tax=Psilocybe cyanescens TaxID=93625 RepID=A0A409XG56_PSICY|nr:hypothetical protein CVT25_014146 [Psilocybe cyanescens]